MEDELEDRIVYQTYISFSKTLSRLTSSVPLVTALSYLWKMVRLYLLRSEVLIFTLAVILFFMYLHSIELWSRALLSRLSHAMSPLSAVQRMKSMDTDGERQSWEKRGDVSAAYAIKGRRPHMEDRFIIDENINSTGISLFAIFDGHGGDFAANYAQNHLIQNLHNKIVELHGFREGKIVDSPIKESQVEETPKEEKTLLEKKSSFKKSVSTADDTSRKEITDPELLAQLSKARPITREVGHIKPVKHVVIPLSSYIDKNKINFGKLLTDEVLSADRSLVEAAKRSMSVAGTTALITIMEGEYITVANVGDSRGVMCDSKGNAIPVSFDHKPQQAMSPLSAVQRMKSMDTDGERQSWEKRGDVSAAYAIKGRRPHMEDRFIIDENINSTGISLFAIFDGHGGDFAANYAQNHLIQNLHNKIVELHGFREGKIVDSPIKESQVEETPKEEKTLLEKKSSFKKSVSTADDTSRKEITDPELLAQLSKARPITREVGHIKPVKHVVIPLSSYIDKNKINFGKLLTDEVLSADRSLVEAAKRSMSVAGTTALITIMEGEYITVANVGDSRGVMCDSKGNAIPVSFDHKPQQVREQKRIEAAGGYIAFNGVWRVAGILATSRAMGDYPLKDKKFVIADPDILTFNLEDHKPMFLVLASDGLWDTFTNEEAVKFIKERLHEPDHGAKSLTLQAYYRGSVDNITVLVIKFPIKTQSETAL